MVSDYAVSYFFTDGYPDTMGIGICFFDVHDQLAVGMGFRRSVYGLEI